MTGNASIRDPTKQKRFHEIEGGNARPADQPYFVAAEGDGTRRHREMVASNYAFFIDP